MKKNSKSPMKKEPKAKRAKAQRPVQRDTKEVLAELVEKLSVTCRALLPDCAHDNSHRDFHVVID